MRRIIYTGLFIFSFSIAGAQTDVPHTFQAGQPARASEVNANFDALSFTINGSSADIQQLQTENATMRATIDVLNEQLAEVNKFIDQSSRERIQTTLDIQLHGGEYFGCVLFSPPSDTRLILDQISADFSIPIAGDQRGSVLVRTLPDPGTSSFARHYFAFTATGQVRGGRAQYIFNEQPSIFHDASNGPLQICLQRGEEPNNVADIAFGSITLSGSLESMM
jgi:hypothetical protein